MTGVKKVNEDINDNTVKIIVPIVKIFIHDFSIH